MAFNLGHFFLTQGLKDTVFYIYLPNLSLLLKSAPLLNSKLRHSTFLQRSQRVKKISLNNIVGLFFFQMK